MGVNGVIVDLVEEITGAVSEFTEPEIVSDAVADNRVKATSTGPCFSERQLAFLLKLIPELLQHS